jgi:hypothetical protein
MRVNQWVQPTPRPENNASRSEKVLDTGFRSDRCSTLEILFQLFEELVESFLVRPSHGDEAHADLASTVPTHRSPVENNR